MIFACYALIWVIVFFMGASVFSFINVVAYRVPAKLSLWRDGSFCPKCGEPIKKYDLIPVLSWLFLRGKCRSCKSPISPRYPLIELLGGALAVLCVYHYGMENPFQSVTVFAAFAVMTAVAIIDADTMEIPDGLHIALCVPALAALFVFPQVGLLSRIIGMFCVSVPLLIIALVIPGAFGGGDIKLMIPAGFFLGWKLSLAALFIAVLLGGGYGIYLMASGKKGKKEHFAFGPALCIGIACAALWGDSLIAWYLGLFL